MEAVTIFVAHEPKTFEGNNGPWTLHKFKDQNGTYFQTTKQQIANAAYALLNKPAAVTFDVEERTSGSRTFKNNVISAVVAAAEGTALTPTSNPDNGGARGGGGGGRGGYAPKDQAVINRSAALSRAIETVAAGIISPEQLGGSDGLFKLADRYVKYIETAPAAQGGAVSSDGGGAVAGAEAPTSAPAAAPAETAAPAAAPAAAAPGPDDDIPF